MDENLMQREKKREALNYFGAILGLVFRDNFCHPTSKRVTCELLEVATSITLGLYHSICEALEHFAKTP